MKKVGFSIRTRVGTVSFSRIGRTRLTDMHSALSHIFYQHTHPPSRCQMCPAHKQSITFCPKKNCSSCLRMQTRFNTKSFPTHVFGDFLFAEVHWSPLDFSAESRKYVQDQSWTWKASLRNFLVCFFFCTKTSSTVLNLFIDWVYS